MGKEYNYDKECRYCGKQLTSKTTSRNFINDQNYICFDCAGERLASGGYRIRNLEQVYDPNKNKVHNEIYKKAQLHTDQVEIQEELGINPPKPKEKKYPTPKGRSITIRHMEVVCRDCDTVLTTTNAYPERVKTSIFICKHCEHKIEIERDNDPLYKDKRAIKSILLKLYARRRLKQFTWEYVKIRFAEPTVSKITQVDKDEYDKVIRLFGEEYATKRFKPKTILAIQISFGDLSSRERCVKLLTLFEYELYKSQHSGKRRKKQFEAKQYLKMFDPDYNHRRSDKNSGTNADDYETHDKFAEEAYTKTTYRPQKWDPYVPEAT